MALELNIDGFFIDLGKTYYDFHIKYSSKTCNNCNKFPNNNSLLICLLCDVILCNGQCN